MANSTATLTQVGVEHILPGNIRQPAEWAGGDPDELVSKQFALDITAAKADGAALTLAALGLTSLVSFRVVAQEKGGYVAQFIPTSMPSSKGSYVGAGVVKVYEAGADAAALDELVGDEDAGVFLIEVVGIE